MSDLAHSGPKGAVIPGGDGGKVALNWRTAYPGNWKTDFAGYIWSDSLKGGLATPAQVRGWGYLTGRGHGALGLSDADGIRIQAEVGWVLAAAPDLLAACEMAVGPIGSTGPTPVYEALTAAIAKAKGWLDTTPSPTPHGDEGRQAEVSPKERG